MKFLEIGNNWINLDKIVKATVTQRDKNNVPIEVVIQFQPVGPSNSISSLTLKGIDASNLIDALRNAK